MSRGSSPGDDGVVAYGVMRSEDVKSFETLERASVPSASLRHAFALREQLDRAWAARPVALLETGSKPLLLVEHPGGVFLNRVSWGRPRDLRQILRCALGLARALAGLHGQRLVHRGLSPTAVLVDVASGRAWLAGFWATTSPPEPGAASVARWSGGLPYMAPEETGRVQRSVDARSDLYSFGVLLYELLSGTLPLTGVDLADWVHAHVAKPPAPLPASAQVPTSLQAIVMKLLSKNAEQRYQTADGVARDLQRCLTQLQDYGAVDDFALGEDDVPAELSRLERVYGRESELAVLNEAFERVVSRGSTELVLISGYSGVGKSSLVRELSRSLLAPRGWLVSGKLDRLKRDVPFAALTRALQQRLRAALATSETELARLREALRDELGASARLLVPLLPEVALVLGELPAVPELPPEAAKLRFLALLGKLVAALAGPQHPLVVFLDDLQWLDPATLELLELLLTRTKASCLLLIGAYRDNEVDQEHPLWLSLGRLRAAEASMTELRLAPLAQADVTRLLRDALRCSLERAAPLAALIRDKTDGNPFFVTQFLDALVDRNLLVFQTATRAWSFELSDIETQAFTENVAELVLERLRRLPETTQDTLGALACLGDRGTVADLSAASGKDAARIKDELLPVLTWGALRRDGDDYSFSHDRIREASLALLSEDERAGIHLRVGRRLLAAFPDGVPETRLFDVVDQLSRGAPLMETRREREASARLQLAAGRLARESAATAAALAYFEAGLRLLDEHSWQHEYSLGFALALGRVECVLGAGESERARLLLEELLPRARAPFDTTRVRRCYVVLHVIESEYAEAVRWGLEALSAFGISMPAHPRREEVETAYADVVRLLNGRSPEALAKLPTTSDLEVSAPMSVLAELFAPACFTDESLAFLHLCRMVQLTLERGITEPAAHAFAWFGVMLGHFFGDYHEGARYVQLARELTQRLGFVAYEAKTLFSMEIIRLWTSPLSEAIEAIRVAFTVASDTGDLPIACFACHHVVSDRLVRGDALDDVLRETEKSLGFVRRAGYRDVIDELVTHQRFIQALRGQTVALASFDGDGFDSLAFEAALTPNRMPTMSFWYWVLKAQVQFLAGSFLAAYETLERARALSWSSPVHIQYLNYHLFSLLTLCALHGTELPGSSSAERRDRAARHREKLAHWAEINPDTFQDKLLLADAEWARTEGDDYRALGLYEQAARVARERGFLGSEALAHEQAARFHDARGYETLARGCWLAARRCYDRWGALGKVRQLDSLARLDLSATGLESSPGHSSAALEELDFKNVIHTLQQVSREIVLEQLVDRLLRSALQTAGADRGVLVMQHGEQLSCVAEAKVVQGTVELLSVQHPSQLGVPESVIRYALRTKEAVIVEDASVASAMQADPYFDQHRPLSMSCLPITTQGRISGALYLENSLARHAFTPRRVQELTLLASQAAISLENARLYGEVQRESAERLRAERLLAGEKRLLEMVATGSPRASTLEALCSLVEEVVSGVTCAILVLDPKTGLLRLGAAPSWPGRKVDSSAVSAGNELFGPNATVAEERRPLFMPDLAKEPRWPTFRERVLQAGFRGCWCWPICSNERTLGTVALYFREPGMPSVEQERIVEQLTHVANIAIARARTEQTLHQLRSELAHVSRVATLGELTASIAHEVNQPLSGIAMNGRASLRWLDRAPPELSEARAATERILRDATRASETIGRLRELFRRGGVAKSPVDLEELVSEVLLIAQHEIARHGAVVTASLPPDFPQVLGERVQLQQVLINLILNGLEAMSYVEGRARNLRVSARQVGDDAVEVSVTDSGIGAGLDGIARLFEPFVTSKPGGMGMGLSISRSIVEDHGGRIWAEQGEPYGMVFRFTLPRGS